MFFYRREIGHKSLEFGHRDFGGNAALFVFIYVRK
jgi:hypothetical protein